MGRPPGGTVAVAGPRGVAVAGPHGAVAVARPAPRPPVVVPPPRPPVGAFVAGAAVGAAIANRNAPPPPIYVLPPGYKRAYYAGYDCYYVNGIYYRPEFQGGETVYVVVTQ